VEKIFAVKDDHILKGKHILLVDDVITTGSTVEEAVNALQKNSDCRISLLTAAYAPL
jgi:predicted amidophosphoribosyltransferase